MKVAVIGAGACGLPTIKSCLDEGLEVVCFDRRATVGGLWNYSESGVDDGLATVMWNTVANMNKELMSFSDFPAPREFPQFMPHAKQLEYYQMYAKHFKLIDHIRFRVQVIRVSQTSEEGYRNSGQWEVTTKSLETEEIKTELFDGVFVCNGHEGKKYVPEFDGLADFQGQTVHSHDYRDVNSYKNKRVVIVGCGNSAFDIAADLSNVCSQVYLSSRRGSWIIPRFKQDGLPFDIGLNNRFDHSLPEWYRGRKLREWLNSRFNHAYYGVEPDYGVGAHMPSVNDFAPSLIASGALLIRPAINRITPRGVVFSDGSSVDQIDAIIFATGYSADFSFIDHKAFNNDNDNDLLLYKRMFVPEIKPPTLAVIGYHIEIASRATTSEMQARFSARVMRGAIKLPTADKMRNLEQKYRDLQRTVCIPSRIQFIRIVDPLQYMDSLAEEIGCKPPGLFQLLFTDPQLCKAVYTGTLTTYQYRLVGPGAWSGARQAVLGTLDRLQYPVNAKLAHK